MQAETPIRRRIREALNASGRVRVFPNPRGFDREHKRWYGLSDGAADLVGFLRGGRWCEFEVKRHAEGSRPEATQLARAKVVRAWGGFYTFVRSPEEAMAALERAEKGLHE
jgi:hypothetical protein